MKEKENKSTDLGYRTWPNEKLRYFTYPSTAGERSGRLLPLDRYLLCVCRRGGRPGPQCSPPPRGLPRDPPSPPGTEPPNGPVPRLTDPLPPPGTRSESGLSRSRLNGLSTNNSCHSYSERDCYEWVMYLTQTYSKNPHQQQLHNLCLRQERCCGRKGSTYLGKLWSCVIKAIWTTVQKTKDETITFMSDLATYCCFMELCNIHCSTADCHSEGVINLNQCFSIQNCTIWMSHSFKG